MISNKTLEQYVIFLKIKLEKLAKKLKLRKETKTHKEEEFITYKL